VTRWIKSQDWTRYTNSWHKRLLRPSTWILKYLTIKSFEEVGRSNSKRSYSTKNWMALSEGEIYIYHQPYCSAIHRERSRELFKCCRAKINYAMVKTNRVTKEWENSTTTTTSSRKAVYWRVACRAHITKYNVTILFFQPSLNDSV
jgi:hypothetical protein